MTDLPLSLPETSPPQLLLGPTGSRRAFLGSALGLGAGLALGTPLGAASLQSPAPPTPPAPADPPPSAPAGGAPSGRLPASFPQQEPDLVRRVVGASHGDLETVRELVTARPDLAKAQWDWGFGDWESALGAASHTGQREIAELLIAHGARPTLFSAAMLGQLEVVKAFVEASPGIQGTPGPHGIPLLVHARLGGERAAAVAAYLERVGGADGETDGSAAPEPLTEEGSAAYVGTYRTAAGEAFEVARSPRGLTLGFGEGFPRTLIPVATESGTSLAFHPAGAAGVRVLFLEPRDGLSPAFELRDGDLRVEASRESVEP